MKRKHQRTLDLVFAHPTSANVQWRDIEAQFTELGAEVMSEREVVLRSSCLRRCESSIARIRLQTQTRARLPASESGWNNMELSRERYDN